MAHQVDRVPLRLSPEISDPGLIPARGPLLHVLPSLAHNSCLSHSIIEHQNKSEKINKYCAVEIIVLSCYISRWMGILIFALLLISWSIILV